jgi:hypothetical protein
MHEWDCKSIDVMRIGDSFFNGGGGDLNPYIQDYMATQHDLDVVNISSNFHCDDPVRRLVILLNGGMLKKVEHVGLF